MDNTRLNQHIYKWAKDKCCSNFVNCHKDMVAEGDMDYFMDFDIVKNKFDIKMSESKLMSNFVENRYDD